MSPFFLFISMSKSGDHGNTESLYGLRMKKFDLLFSAYGDLDELNAAIGLSRSSQGIDAETQRFLTETQKTILVIGSLLEAPDLRQSESQLIAKKTANLESIIEAREKSAALFTGFVLPGENPSSASMHFARTVCRRAERSVVAFLNGKNNPNADVVMRYINRLSRCLFALAMRF